MYPSTHKSVEDSCKEWGDYLKKLKNKPGIGIDKDLADTACGKFSFLIFNHGNWTVTTRKENPERLLTVDDGSGHSVTFMKIEKRPVIIISKDNDKSLLSLEDTNKDGKYEKLSYTSYKGDKENGYFADFNMDGIMDLRIPTSGVPEAYIHGKWYKYYYTKIKGRPAVYIIYKGKRYLLNAGYYPYKLTLLK